MADKQIFGPRGIVFVENDKILVRYVNNFVVVAYWLKHSGRILLLLF